MEATIAMPRGLEDLIEFKRLCLNVGGRHNAIAAVWHLFAHLANSVRAGQVGLLATGDREILVAELQAKAELAALEEAGFLVPTEGGSHCELFARHNRHLDPGNRSRESKGGAIRSFNYVLKRAEAGAVAQMSLLPPHLFEVDGRVLNSTEIAQVRMLVCALDGVTGRADRASHEGDWPNDLIASAWRVVAKHGQERAIQLCRELVRLGFDVGSGRANPAIPSTTELALPRFDQLVELVRRHPENKL